MRSEVTQHNRQRLLTILRSRQGDPRLGNKPLLAFEGALTVDEAKFIGFWKTLSFTAHHATQYLKELKSSGKLSSVHDRQVSGSLNAVHTGGAARQKYIYFSFGVGGVFSSPMFIGHNPALITLPLHCFNSKSHSSRVEQISLSNHDHWFSHNQQTDPIEINNVIRYIRFNEKYRTKTYHYYNTKTGHTWQRQVTALEETYYAKSSTDILLEILGLQFLIELYEFDGPLREKILKDPASNKKTIIKLFSLLFPSEIYPEFRVEGSLPLALSGVSIQKALSQRQLNIDPLHNAIAYNDRETVDRLLNHGVPIDGMAECKSQCCQYSCEAKHKNTPVLTAFRSGNYDIGFELIRRGANIQTVSFNHPEHLLQLVVERIKMFHSESSLCYYSRIDKHQLYELLHKLSNGIHIAGLNGVKQHFSLAHKSIASALDIVELIKLCQLSDKDSEAIKYLKNLILKQIVKLIPMYKPFGLCKELYSKFFCRYQSDEQFYKNTNMVEKLIQEHKLDINHPSSSSTTFLMLAAFSDDVRSLNWAMQHDAKIYPPKHSLSIFEAALQSPSSFNATKNKLNMLNWLLTQLPLNQFSQEDLEYIARLLESNLIKRNYRKENILLSEIRKLFTQTEEAKAVFTEVDKYPNLDYAVGAVIFVTVNKKVYTLLVVRSEYQNNQSIYYCGPGGLVDLGEDPKTAIFREIFEETQLRINTKQAKINSIPYEYKETKIAKLDNGEKQVVHHMLKRTLYKIDLGEQPFLPLIGAYDDVLDVEWVPVDELKPKLGVLSYKGKQLWKSNSLLIQAHRENKPVDVGRVQQALYLESDLGQSRLSEYILLGDIAQIEKLAKYANINIGEVMFLATAGPENRSLLKTLIACGGNINKVHPDGKTILHRRILEITSNFPMDEAKHKQKLAWLSELIDHFQADWAKYTNPKDSFLSVITLHSLSDDNGLYADFLIKLIQRKDNISPDIHKYCFSEASSCGKIKVLDCLLESYPKITIARIKDEENILLAAETSVKTFQWLLTHGAIVSKHTLNKVEALLEDAEQPFQAEAKEDFSEDGISFDFLDLDNDDDDFFKLNYSDNDDFSGSDYKDSGMSQISSPTVKPASPKLDTSKIERLKTVIAIIKKKLAENQDHTSKTHLPQLSLAATNSTTTRSTSKKKTLGSSLAFSHHYH